MDLDKTYYDILGLGRGSSRSDIVRVFREVVKEHHPDRFSTPEEKREAEEYLKNVTEAFNTLSKPELRKKYDEALDVGKSTVKKQSPGERVEQLLHHGMGMLQREDLQGALSIFDHILRLDADNIEALFQAGMVRLRNPKWRPKGSEQVESAIERAPFKSAYVVAYSRVLLQNGQNMRARRFLEKASADFPGDEQLRELLSLARSEKSAGFSLFGKKR